MGRRRRGGGTAGNRRPRRGKGNVYKARVTNIEKSIGAAFLEFGHNRQGFLHVSDLCMSAVGEGARDLLASVQAAREHAHDDDMDGLASEPDESKAVGRSKADAKEPLLRHLALLHELPHPRDG